jgi:type I restriction enzyme, S subunit
MSAVEGWITKRLDEIGTICSGSTPSTSVSSFWDGEIIWVTPNDLSKQRTPYLKDSGKRITEKGLNGCSAQLTPPGSLVMSSRAPIGYVALPTIPFCTNQGCKTIVLKTQFHPEFAYYNLLFNIDKVKNLGEGTTFAEISKSALSAVKLDFPTSPSEQDRIAEILLTVDRAIEQTEAVITKQQRIKTGLMQDLLTHGIDEHGNLRSEQTHKFKDSPMGRIPAEWEVKSFGEILGKGGGLLQTGPFGSQLHSHDYVSDGVPVVMPQDIASNGISTANIARITEKKAESLKRHRMIPGDLVFARRGDLSRCAIIGAKERGWLCGTGCLLMRPPIKVLSPRWTADTYRFHPSQLQVAARAVGSTMPNLNTGIISDIKVALPSIEEQTRIESQLQAVDYDGIAIMNRLQKLRILKTALMQDLLTGKKRVTASVKRGKCHYS